VVPVNPSTQGFQLTAVPAVLPTSGSVVTVSWLGVEVPGEVCPTLLRHRHLVLRMI
jgi:hypothetical protein